MSLLDIESFYRNKSIFITGATGFLGKVLIEKLLRSCPYLEKIYILVRPKRGIDSSKRLDELFNSKKLFERLIKTDPDFKEKIHVIQGNLLEENLGISELDRELLIKKVNIIFHSAATIRFNEPLKIATKINVIGTKQVIDLSKLMKHLQVFVHVSTAFSNCDQSYIIEEVYEPKIPFNQLISITDNLEEDLVDLITPQLIKKMPNTYTFTKQIAESLVIEQTVVPTIILRPSIVGAALNEPFPGWIDNFSAATGLFYAQYTGLLRCMIGDPEVIFDIVPVDTVINMMIASACYINSNSDRKLLVLNCNSDESNKASFQTIGDIINKLSYEMPTHEVVLLPTISFTKNRLLNSFRNYFEHILPAYLIDLVLRLTNKKPFLLRVQQKLQQSVSVLEFFTTTNFIFKRRNFQLILDQMSEKEKQIFPFDTADMNWKEYIINYYKGIKLYLAQPTKKDNGKEKILRLKLARNGFVLLCVVGIMFFTIVILGSF